MKTTLVINPKGGSGKTTIAINLAACFAVENVPTTLMDYDPQASSLTWLRSRAPDAPTIYAANGAPEKYGRMRSFEMFVPPHTQQLIIDAPAGASGLLLQEMVERSHSVIVPVVPSIIDIRATESFIRDLLSAPRVRNGDARVAVAYSRHRHQVADEILGGADVDDRRHHRHHHAVRALDHFLQQQSVSAGRRVDDELLRVRRHEHLEAAHAAVFFRSAVGGIDHRRIRRARA